MYVVLDDGTREELPYAAEEGTAQRLTGKSLLELGSEGRIGFRTPYLCRSCLDVTNLDPRQEALVCGPCTHFCASCGHAIRGKFCTHCGQRVERGFELTPLTDMVGAACPRCGQGTLEREVAALP